MPFIINICSARARKEKERERMIFDIQKASITKRLVAFILDMILFAVLAVGFAWLLGLMCDYDTQLDANISTQDAYTTFYKRTYGVDFGKTYESLNEAEKALYDTYSEQFNKAVSEDISVNISLDKIISYQSKYFEPIGLNLFATDTEYEEYTPEQKTAWLAAYEACSIEFKGEAGDKAFLMKPVMYVRSFEEKFSVDLTANPDDIPKAELKNWYKAHDKCVKVFEKDTAYSQGMLKLIGFTLMMISLGVLLSMLVLEFVVPLLFKNGQTIGKKVFGVAVVHQNGVKVNAITMFIRTFLGKYAVETMVPILLVFMMFTSNAIMSLIVIVLLFVFEIVLFVWRKDTRPFIHDVFAKTVTVDLASQMIFDSEEQMAEFRRNAYAEASGDTVADQIYGTSNPLADSFVEVDNKEDNK